MISRRNTKSVQVAEEYRELLQKRKLKAGTKAETVDELAELYGISHRTAGKVHQILEDEDVLYSKRGSGTFIKHDPPKILKVGCTWNEFKSSSCDAEYEYLLRHTRLIKKAFREADLNFHAISYESLFESGKGELELKELDGLLLHKGYLDKYTFPVIKKFKKTIVMIGNEAIEDRLPVHQIMTDWESILNDLIPAVKPFHRLLILSPDHCNGRYLESLLQKIYSGHDIQTAVFSYPNWSQKSYQYFLNHQTGYENTLIFSLSNVFSESLRRAFGTQPLPSLIELDNLERYMPDAEHNSVFSAIDHEYDQIYAKALDLLKKQILHNDGCRYIIRVRPKLIVRKSFVPKYYDMSYARSFNIVSS